MTTPLTGEQLIGGAPTATGTETFQATSPRTGERVGPAVHEATTRDVDAAATAAAAAFGELRIWDVTRRAELLSAVADALDAAGSELVAKADEETALGVSPRLEGELARTTGQLRSFARWITDGHHVEAIIDTSGPDVRRASVALGPVGVFGASNFPLAFGVAGGDTASALAAGCPVIAKGHPSHPGTSELVGRVIVEACRDTGAPAGVFSLLQGSSNAVGGALVGHPAVKAVGFTGSLAGGRALADLGARREEPIPVYAEMGSVNPVFVLPGAIHGRAGEIATGFAGSMTQGNGQFCTKPGVLVVPDGQPGDDLVAAIAAELDDHGGGVMLNERIAAAYRDDLSRLTKRPDVEVIRELGAAPDAGPYACAPALLSVGMDVFVDDAELREEHFGPVCVVVRGPVDRLPDVAGALPGTLTATIHAADGDLDVAGELQTRLTDRTGRVIYNGYPTGVAVVPAMQHGGPYPATTQPASTSVGMTAIQRFLRPVAFQDAPDEVLPAELRDANPLGLPRLVDWELTTERIQRG